jgi:hypothetical protein
MFGEGDAPRSWSQGADMGHDVAGVECDLDLVPRLARFHAAPDPNNRSRGANRVSLPSDAGTYYLVFNNKFSLVSPKAVQDNLTR